MDKVLEDANHLNDTELEQLLHEVAQLLAMRKGKTLSHEETTLLNNIYKPAFSPDEQKQYDTLYKKLQAGIIDKIEHHTLIALIEKQEQHHVDRLKNLMALAHIKKISLDELMNQLGIRQVSDNA